MKSHLYACGFLFIAFRSVHSAATAQDTSLTNLPTLYISGDSGCYLAETPNALIHLFK